MEKTYTISQKDKKSIWESSLLCWLQYEIYRRTLLMESYGILLCGQKKELNVTPDRNVLIKDAKIKSRRYLKALCRCKYIILEDQELPNWFRTKPGQIILDAFCDLKIEAAEPKTDAMPGLRKQYKKVRNIYCLCKKKLKETIKYGMIWMKKIIWELDGYMKKKGLFLDENEKRLYNYRNKHQGQRCFLIGNGPSLSTSDLELLKQEITFSCNMIVKIYDDTDWRPTYHCMIDTLIAKYQSEELTEKLSCPLFTNSSIEKVMKALPENRVVIRNLGQKKYEVRGNMMAYYVPSGATVMSFMMELAMFMGFREIYLLGVDCTSSMSSSGHFIKNYRDESMKEKDKERICKRLGRTSMTDEEVGEYYFEKSMDTYRVIQNYAKKHDIQICNCTRGGALEVFPRVPLEEVLSGE